VISSPARNRPLRQQHERLHGVHGTNNPLALGMVNKLQRVFGTVGGRAGNAAAVQGADYVAKYVMDSDFEGYLMGVAEHARRVHL
jgi:hypothetical protein